MNFDFGEVLTRAAQITWKHKALWLFGALPSLVGVLAIPLFFGGLLFTGFDPSGNPLFFTEPLYFVFFFIGIAFFGLLSFILYGLSSASLTAGALRAEDGAEYLSLLDSFNEGKQYWLRTLGVWLLLILTIGAVFFVFLICLLLFGVVTVGLGFLCIQPLILLTYPLTLVVYGGVEEALAALIADNLDIFASIQRGWELLKAKFWSIFLLSFIVYFAVAVLNMLVTMPFMLPFFFTPFVLRNTTDMRNLMLLTSGISLLLVPLTALVQGVGMTFQKAAYAITYLRLTRPKADVSIVSETNA